MMAIWGPVLAAVVVFVIGITLEKNRNWGAALGGLVVLSVAAIIIVQLLALVLQ